MTIELDLDKIEVISIDFSVTYVKSQKKIAKLFGGKVIPTTKILDALRNKPIPVSIREGMKANAAKQPLNPTAILTAMLDKKAKAK